MDRVKLIHKVGAALQPCFIPLLVVTCPRELVVLKMYLAFLWSCCTMLMRSGGTWWSRSDCISRSRLTLSNALLRSKERQAPPWQSSCLTF